jgi:hypothetical protein
MRIDTDARCRQAGADIEDMRGQLAHLRRIVATMGRQLQTLRTIRIK